MVDFPGRIFVPPARWWRFRVTLLGGGMFFTGGRMAFIEHQRYKLFAPVATPVDVPVRREARELSQVPVKAVINRLGRGIEDSGVMGHING